MKTRKILHAKITGMKMVKRNHYRVGKRLTYVEQLIQETGKTNIKTITLKKQERLENKTPFEHNIKPPLSLAIWKTKTCKKKKRKKE